MIQRDLPQLLAATRHALRCLSFLLVPALAPKTTHALPRARSTPSWTLNSEPAPYLVAAGPVSLRIKTAPPPPDLSVKPPAAAPPLPTLSPTETSVAQANTDAIQSATIVHPPKPAADKSTETPNIDRAAPPPIIPDDNRSTVRPEDFLPFFQFPGSTTSTSGQLNVIVPVLPSTPANSPVPPSSATYTQTPK